MRVEPRVQDRRDPGGRRGPGGAAHEAPGKTVQGRRLEAHHDDLQGTTDIVGGTAFRGPGKDVGKIGEDVRGEIDAEGTPDIGDEGPCSLKLRLGPASEVPRYRDRIEDARDDEDDEELDEGEAGGATPGIVARERGPPGGHTCPATRRPSVKSGMSGGHPRCAAAKGPPGVAGC